ncbi:MAG: adenine phosphoribosyltransferase [Deltaproteobacteria bacterium]
MEQLKRHIRAVPDFPKKGILFRDITPLLQHREAFRETIDAMYDIAAAMGVDCVVGIESRGFILASALAYRLGVGLAIVRKPGKLPHEKISASYALEYGTDSLEAHTDAVSRGARALIVDDLLATGGTAAAAGSLIKRLGGDVAGYLFLIELQGLAGRERLAPSSVRALMEFPA